MTGLSIFIIFVPLLFLIIIYYIFKSIVGNSEDTILEENNPFFEVEPLETQNSPYPDDYPDEVELTRYYKKNT